MYQNATKNKCEDSLMLAILLIKILCLAFCNNNCAYSNNSRPKHFKFDFYKSSFQTTITVRNKMVGTFSFVKILT